MYLGMIGLGKMGGNMVRRLMKGGHQVVGYNRTADITDQLAAEAGLIPAYSIQELIQKLPAPRAVWVMVPAGTATEETVLQLSEMLSPDDIIIDGGNSFYKDDIRRAPIVAAKGLHYVDTGTSGGIWGITEGYSMMIGGDPEIVERLRPIYETLAPAAR